MKIFLDSTDLTEIENFVSYGVIDGITTNPSLVANSTLSFEELVKKIIAIINTDVSVEVISNDYDGMIRDGSKILDIYDGLVIKLPITWEGIKACNYFSKQNIKVNMTLCFSLNQALLAAKAGATYVSPFIGRLEDSGKEVTSILYEMRHSFDRCKVKTQILAASIRTIRHVEQVAYSGADAITIPPKLLSGMIEHHLTNDGLKKFNDDWIKSGKTI